MEKKRGKGEQSNMHDATGPALSSLQLVPHSMPLGPPPLHKSNGQHALNKMTLQAIGQSYKESVGLRRCHKAPNQHRDSKHYNASCIYSPTPIKQGN